jgi:RNA polymerase sigma-70 factor (ECF subfamily)
LRKKAVARTRDEELVLRAVSRAKEGDRSALHYLYARYADDVYAYTQTIVRDSHDAEDVTQSVFTKLITSIQKYEPQGVPFTAWILRVARNAALDHLRAKRLVPCEEIRMVDEGSEYVRVDRSRSIQQALSRLPREQREVLVLRHIAGMSPGEIADRLGKTEGAVHALHHRGRGALQEQLRQLGAVPVTTPA